jgi:hypothetical protein
LSTQSNSRLGPGTEREREVEQENTRELNRVVKELKSMAVSDSTKAKTDLFYGSTKTTKTSQIGRAAQYFFKKTGKPTLLYSADPGGWDPIQTLVDMGIVQAINVRGLSYAPETVDRLSQGWIVEEGKLKPAPKGYWDKFAVVAFEGLASMGEWCMDWYSLSGQKLGMNQSYANIKIGETIYHGVSQDHYGDVQSRLLRCVVNSNQLPVERVIWTSLETKGKDEISGTAMIGPTLVGNKKVDRAGQYFGNMIHLDLLEETKVDEKTKVTIVSTKPVMFLRHHQDTQTKLVIPAGTRAPFEFAHEVPAYLDPPDAGKLYQLLDDLRAKAKAQLERVIN